MTNAHQQIPKKITQTQQQQQQQQQQPNTCTQQQSQTTQTTQQSYSNVLLLWGQPLAVATIPPTCHVGGMGILLGFKMGFEYMHCVIVHSIVCVFMFKWVHLVCFHISVSSISFCQDCGGCIIDTNAFIHHIQYIRQLSCLFEFFF